MNNPKRNLEIVKQFAYVNREIVIIDNCAEIICKKRDLHLKYFFKSGAVFNFKKNRFSNVKDINHYLKKMGFMSTYKDRAIKLLKENEFETLSILKIFNIIENEANIS